MSRECASLLIVVAPRPAPHRPPPCFTPIPVRDRRHTTHAGRGIGCPLCAPRINMSHRQDQVG
eukprot:7248648-Prymnesium_polylepis.1